MPSVSDKHNPEISVIMGVYNQFNKDILLKAVHSILDQTFKDFEFIIYDDGSNKAVGDYLKEIEKLDSRIILIGQDVNHGLAFSLNECIGRARGKYIARMDSDDISEPNRLKVQREYLINHPEFGWCGCNATLINEDGVWGIRKMPEFPTMEDYLKFSPYIHPSVMYRSEIFDSNEGYSVSKEMLRCEDYEIFMRLRQAGFRGANIQDNLFRYRENRNSYKRRTWKNRINESKCRYRNFKTMKILWPKGFWYVLRPIIGGLVPNKVIYAIKRKESGGKNAVSQSKTSSVSADSSRGSESLLCS